MPGPKPGVRHGGRQKGTPNKVTAKREAEIAATGLTPLQFLLSVVRDKKAPKSERISAAVSAAPYVHPKLSSIAMQVAGDADNPLKHTMKATVRFVRPGDVPSED
jgi:hypothetical protein